MTKILVTGGLGYVGYDLIKKLLENKENEIIIYDNLYKSNFGILFHKRLHDKNVMFVEGDILDERKLTSAGKGVSVIYHLAAKANSPYGIDDFHMYDYVNNWGTANIVKVALAEKVEKLIYMSSLSIFGHSDTLLTGSSTPEPGSDYAKSKYAGEQQLQVLEDVVDYTIVRSGNIYGYNPSIRLDTVVNNFVYKAIFKQTMVIHGDGQESRGFISIDRLSSQLARVFTNNLTDRVYHLCDHTVKIMELVEIIRDIIPSVQYRHVNPNRKMTDQRFERSTLPGIVKLEEEELTKRVQYFVERFTVTGLR